MRADTALIPGHFFPFFCNGDVRAAFERESAEDWDIFVAVRAAEMRRGARLAVVLPGISQGKISGVGGDDGPGRWRADRANPPVRSDAMPEKQSLA